MRRITMISKKKIEIIKKIIDPYFDYAFYREQISSLGVECDDLLDHYVNEGWLLGLDPNTTFSVKSYIESNPIVIKLETEPLYHSLLRAGVNHNLLLERNKHPKKINQHTYEVLSSFFDIEFYKMQVGALLQPGEDCILHYLEVGCKIGLDPNPKFSTKLYKRHHNLEIDDDKVFYHWITEGRGIGLQSFFSLWPAHEYTVRENSVYDDFDFIYYLKSYPDVESSKENPLIHYMRKGWLEGKNPNREFKTTAYLLQNPDVVLNGNHPFYHYVQQSRLRRVEIDEAKIIREHLGNKIFHAIQDISFPNSLAQATKVAVFLVPQHNEMSGGIFSIFSIANVVRRTKSIHGYYPVVMTIPNSNDDTYYRQHNFTNSENVFRFSQINRCKNLKELYIHIPEYWSKKFVSAIDINTTEFLNKIENLHINILNQNTELMPESSVDFTGLRELATTSLSQSVAHHAYFGQSFSDKYNLATHLLPAYTDLSAYTPTSFSKKEDLIIYSLDDAPYKQKCLDILKKNFPEFKFQEVRGISFDEYMDLATRCMFSISFGEGFDGYIAQPIYQGGLGLTVFREDFFPSHEFLKYDIFFESPEQMLEKIVNVVSKYRNDQFGYDFLNKELVAEYDKLYSFDDYVTRIINLMNRNFDLIPGSVDVANIVPAYRTSLSSKSPLY